MHKVLFGVVLFAGCTGGAFSLPSGVPLPEGDHVVTIADSIRSPRTILIHVPPHHVPLPLVLVLHGDLDLASDLDARLGLGAIAEARGVVLAVPQGITRSFVTAGGFPVDGAAWDAYRGGVEPNADLPFLAELRATLVSSGDIDPRRLVWAGVSRGGQMALRVGLELPDEVACVAMAGARNPVPKSPLLDPGTRRFPVVLAAGALDDRLPDILASRDELIAAGYPLTYLEAPGIEHGSFPGEPASWLGLCLDRANAAPAPGGVL